MKKNLLKLKRAAALAVLPMCFAMLSKAQTAVKVVQFDGTETVYSIATSGNVHFDSGNLVIKESSTSTAITTTLSLVRKIVFTDDVMGITDAKNQKSNYSIYPNPTNGVFKIVAPEGEKLNVAIVSVTGRKVHEGVYQNGNSVDMSRFETGMYFVKINNQNFKLIKQ